MQLFITFLTGPVNLSDPMKAAEHKRNFDSVAVTKFSMRLRNFLPVLGRIFPIFYPAEHQSGISTDNIELIPVR